MGAKYIMQYIARVSGGGPNVQVSILGMHAHILSVPRI